MPQIDLITGFPGVGKTTFIKKYAKFLIDRGIPTGILETDCGAVNIDMALLENLIGDKCEVEIIGGANRILPCSHRFYARLVSMAAEGYERVIVEPFGFYDVEAFFDAMAADPLSQWYSPGCIVNIVDAGMGEALSDEAACLLASQTASAGKIVLSHCQDTGNPASDTERILACLNQALERFQFGRRLTEDDILAKDWGALTEEDFASIALGGMIPAGCTGIPDELKNGYGTLLYSGLQMEEGVLRRRIAQVFKDPGCGNVMRIKGFVRTDGNTRVQIDATRHEVKIERTVFAGETLIVSGDRLREDRLDGIFGEDSGHENNRIWKIYGTDYKEMTKKILAAADLAGRIGNRAARIGIKPNLVVASPAQFGGTTHPEVVAGIIEYLQDRGFMNLIVAEGSWVGDRTALAFDCCGYHSLSEKYGVPLVDTQKERWHEVDCAGMKLQITDVIDRIDFLINVPVMKGHCQTKMTCALKNMKGLLPNKEKSRFHRMGLHKPVAHLQKGVHQDFIVVDHICGDLDFEEGGNPVVRNCVMAAADPVLVDSYACHLMQYDVDEVPYVRLAEKLGVGTADLSKAEIIRLNGESEEEELPRRNRILEVSYAVEEVDSCSACYGNLVHALNLLREEGLLDKLHDRIAIGQGMRGKTGPLGIGRCTEGFDTCIMGCPPEPEKIYEELKAYILAHA